MVSVSLENVLIKYINQLETSLTSDQAWCANIPRSVAITTKENAQTKLSFTTPYTYTVC